MTAPVPSVTDPAPAAPAPVPEAVPNPLIAPAPVPAPAPAPASDPGAPAGGDPQPTAEQMAAELAALRARNEELEPLATAAGAAAEAERTDLERATERARTLEEDLATERLNNERLALAVDHSIPAEYQQFIVGASPEERTTNATLLSDLIARANGAAQAPATPAPPSNRPVQTLRPGASPTPPPVPDTSFPASWL